ncbi:hypothetical protein MRX96_044945 [Rhipicephalus microplus]
MEWVILLSFTQDDTPTPDGLTSSLLFAATERSDSGLYTCLTANKFGKDETNIKLLVQETPDAPDDIRVVEATSRRISLRWNTPFNGNSDIFGYFVQWKEVSGTWQKDSRHVEVPGSNTSAVLDDLEPITAYHLRVLSVNKFGRSEPSPMISVTTDEEGFVLYWKSETSDWSELGVDGVATSHTFQDLNCGTRYHFYAVAFNDVGRSEPSSSVSATTSGGAPLAPEKNELLSSNSSAVQLNLRSWKDGGCPIRFITLQYKLREERGWTAVPETIDAVASDAYVLGGLHPGSWYHLLVSASNDAGSTEAQFVFATLTAGGATIPPMTLHPEESTAFPRSVTLVVPIICAFVVVLVIGAVVYMMCNRRTRTHDYSATAQVSGKLMNQF